ncbi:MAG: iron ABC transporter permease, partial [Chloroflexi bacterium]|nr:iron ABC transporter permease [Chloroflexota bacterium]
MSLKSISLKPLTLPRPSIHFRFPGLRLSTILLYTIGLLVAGLMLLTPLYLLIRTAGSGEAALNILLKTSTLQALARTIGLSLAVTVASALLAVPLAWLTTCTDLPGRKMWATAAALPLVLPSYVAAFLFVSTLGPKGLIQQWLYPLTGIERLPEIYGFPGAFIVLTLMSYPFTLLSVRSALQRLDPSLLEAAQSLGLSPWRAFWRVTLPHLRPALVAGSLLVSLYVLRDFGAVTLLRYTTFTRLIYQQYQSFSDRSLAAALSLVLILLTALVLYLDVRTRGKAQYTRRSAGSARQAKVVQLGWWRWPALAFVSLIVVLGLVMPASGLVYWLVRGLSQGQTLAPLWQASANSVMVSLLAAVLTVAAALPVAVLAVRKTSRVSQWLERITYTGYALPGLVIALTLVFFGAQYARPLYQTLPMLLVAYLILFIPQAVGSARTSLLQLPRSLEEAGRSLGHSSTGVFRRITLPLVQPGVLAGGALVFLTCMKELPTTLLLSPTGYGTLATSVWSAISEVFFARAAAPALLLILLSSLPLA